jgi:hypothetical protein
MQSPGACFAANCLAVMMSDSRYAGEPAISMFTIVRPLEANDT